MLQLSNFNKMLNSIPYPNNYDNFNEYIHI